MHRHRSGWRRAELFTARVQNLAKPIAGETVLQGTAAGFVDGLAVLICKSTGLSPEMSGPDVTLMLLQRYIHENLTIKKNREDKKQLFWVSGSRAGWFVEKKSASLRICFIVSL